MNDVFTFGVYDPDWDASDLEGARSSGLSGGKEATSSYVGEDNLHIELPPSPRPITWPDNAVARIFKKTQHLDGRVEETHVSYIASGIPTDWRGLIWPVRVFADEVGADGSRALLVQAWYTENNLVRFPQLREYQGRWLSLTLISSDSFSETDFERELQSLTALQIYTRLERLSIGKRRRVFQTWDEFFRSQGWIAVCAACATPYNEKDCDCGAGVNWWPPEEVLMEMEDERPRERDRVKLVRYTPGFHREPAVFGKTGLVTFVSPTGFRVRFENAVKYWFELRPYRLLGLVKVKI